MKKLRITVDGKVYDVTVQVLEDDEREIGTRASFLSRRLPPRDPAAGATRARSPPRGRPCAKGDPNASSRRSPGPCRRSS